MFKHPVILVWNHLEPANIMRLSRKLVTRFARWVPTTKRNLHGRRLSDVKILSRVLPGDKQREV